MSLPLLARLGLRLRITLVFAGAMALLFGGLSLFAYLRFQSSLDRSLNQGLRSRAEDVRALVMQADSGLRQGGANLLVAPGERFAQILVANGRVVDETPSLAPRALLSAAELRRSITQPTVVARKRIPGSPGSSRLLAIPVAAQGQRLVVVVGTSLRARDSTLADLRTVLLLGGPVALLLASLLGYTVAILALRSVESMRRRAQHISLGEPGQRLPVPPADDELARLARTLNEMLARNEAAFQRERTFVADASHELRSPLAILRAELDVALVGESSHEELRRAVASAAEEAGRLSALAEDLLMLAEADQGSLPIRRESIDISESLERLRTRFEQPARAAGAVIVVTAPDGLHMRADPLRLEQALGNLMDNALHHGASTVVVRAERRGRSVELQVSDDGPGFPPQFLQAAFERFTRADRTRTSGGAGLGLSIVRSVARSHGGEAYIANRPGGGALAWLSIPDSPARRSTDHERVPPSRRPPARATATDSGSSHETRLT
ncbi:MAG: HAMP domain-containing histidine kinase [Actinomycetota bacterium]|nr:HAMP domain-containing histidine kinase [Actinomycetota bacterium]